MVALRLTSQILPQLRDCADRLAQSVIPPGYWQLVRTDAE